MRQKYPIHSFVYVCDAMPEHMSHFDCNFDAIVAGTYSQLCGGVDIKNYCLYKIKNEKVVDKIAWYTEDQLSLLPEQDHIKAAKMIEDYNFRDE